MTTDGPFAETKEALGGFYLIEARDLDEALELARGVPGAPIRLDRGPADPGAALRVMSRVRAGARLTGAAAAHELVDRLFREESGRAVATMIRVLGDFDLAEEAVQEAFARALEVWPVRGRAAQSRGLDHHDRAQSRDRPDPAREATRREDRAAGSRGSRRTGRAGVDGRRR